MSGKKAEPAQEEAATPETFRAIDLARREGMLPAMLPGTRMRPVVENPKAWLYQAAKLRFRFGDEDQMSETEFSARIAAISTVLVR